MTPILLAALLTGHADAHVGLENTTDVRIHADRMEIVTRTSPRLAWGLLGSRAPAGHDPAGQEIALPILRKEAPRLLEVTADGTRMTPLRTDCVFEVENDIAFTLVFPRPTAWPVTVRTGFTHLLGEMDHGTVSIYDHTDSGYDRGIEPIAVRAISRRHPKATFSLAAPVDEEPAVIFRGTPETGRLFWQILMFVCIAGAGVLFLCFRWYRPRAG